MGEEKKISQTGTKDSGYGWGFVLWWHTELVQKVGHQARERYSTRQKMRNNMLYPHTQGQLQIVTSTIILEHETA